jgi:rubrerythrin
MNILECTIKMKRETRAHYGRLAEVATDEELKRLFSLLATAEDEHIDKLVDMQKKMNKLTVQELDKLEESVCVYSPHIDPRHLAEALRHDPDAYRHVVEEEEGTIEVFDQLSDQATSDQLKKLYRLQADKEREHLAMLEHIYFFVEEPRTYLEWGEFSNLKSL